MSGLRGLSRQPSLPGTQHASSSGAASPATMGAPAASSSPAPTTASAPASHAAASHGTASASTSSASALRRSVWNAVIPIVVTVDDAEWPKGADRSLGKHYARMPRVSYMPLLLQDVRENFLSLALDGGEECAVNEKDFWFEFQGVPLRWHWPIGLLYDYYTGNPAPSSVASATRATSASSSLGLSPSRRHSSQASVQDAGLYPPPATNGGNSAAAAPPPVRPSPPLPWHVKLHLSSPPLGALHFQPTLEQTRINFMSMVKEADFVRWGSTKRVTNLRRQDQDALWEGVVKHDFDLYWSVASKLTPPVSSVSGLADTLGGVGAHGPPSRTPSINLSAAGAGIDRRASPDPTSSSASSSVAGGSGGASGSGSGGSGAKFSSVSSASTVTATRPGVMGTHFVNESQTSLTASLYSQTPSEASGAHGASAGAGAATATDVAATGQTQGAAIPRGGTPGTTGQAAAKREGQVRSVPMRFFLPEGAPVVQQPVSPFLDDGRAATLHSVLTALFPLLFPPSPSFSSVQSAPPLPLAYGVSQGIRLPLDCEVGWLGSVLSSADGWVSICIVLLLEGEKA